MRDYGSLSAASMLNRLPLWLAVAAIGMIAPSDFAALGNPQAWPGAAHAAKLKPRRAFNNASVPKPRLKQHFRAKSGQQFAGHRRLVKTPRFQLGSKNRLRQVFRAHANSQPAYRQKLPSGLRNRIFSPAKVNSNRVTLGHYPLYVRSSSKNGTRHFQVPTRIAKKMNSVQMWRANRKFLERAVKRGHEIRLATHGRTAKKGSGFARELAFLRSKGYRLSPNGMKMLPPGRTARVQFASAAGGSRLSKLNQEFSRALKKR